MVTPGKRQIINKRTDSHTEQQPQQCRNKTPQADNLDIREYINDMPVCLAAADVVVARAGAITLSEIEVTGKPSVLIPSPNVAENHQYHNAMSLVKNNAAVMIEEKDLTPEKLTEEIDRLASDPAILAEYSANAAKMAVSDASRRIYSVIIEVLAASKVK